MFKYIVVNIFFLLFLSFPNYVIAGAQSSFITVVNPVRGEEFWDLTELPQEAVKGQAAILQKFNIPATWLLRFDALADKKIVSEIPISFEKGILFEVTPLLAKAASVKYRQSGAWHLPESVFLTGYEPSEREKLIDTAFSYFKNQFGYYPKSVGAWYVDSYSLSYMYEKYKIEAALIVADQYSTDNYQIWGQYFGTPYYPSAKNTLYPAPDSSNKIPVVVMQWAARDPINGYGEGVNETTYSVQPNDYIDYHKLSSDYFTKLVDTYLKQDFNDFNQLVMGLENSYSWNKYKDEYLKQVEIIAKKEQQGEVKLLSMTDFASWYKTKFTGTSPTQIIVAKDILGTDQQVVWYMNNFYRAGWFYNSDGSVFRDVRPFTGGREEVCYSKSCTTINFATFPLHVLDDVTYKQKRVVDQGKISNFSFKKEGDNFILNYTSQAGRNRLIKFLPRDIEIDNKVSSIDDFILDSLNSKQQQQITNLENMPELYSGYLSTFTLKTIKFILFLLLAVFLPGYLLIRKVSGINLGEKIFISSVIGLTMITLTGFLGGVFKLPWLIYLYIGLTVVIAFKQKIIEDLGLLKALPISKKCLIILSIILSGTFFQTLAVIRSGWPYSFGLGFLGPTGHDGLWHQALINQLIKQVPPQNPGFAGEILTNYHYFFDLLVAETVKLSQLEVVDLLYRFFPVLFSLLLGLGTYHLVNRTWNNFKVTLLSLYLIYFAGSFGWVVEYLKTKSVWGGESAFWVNQPISMNLNPPFAISLLMVIAIIFLIRAFMVKNSVITAAGIIILSGALIEFKVYAGLLVLGGLFVISIYNLLINRKSKYFYIFISSLLLALAVFLPQNSQASRLLVFSPFWFIHSMIDFTDRVGWVRLSQGREAYIIRGEWTKFFAAETLGLIIFIIGNLGVRFVGLFAVRNFIKNKAWNFPDKLFITIIILGSMVIPLLFIQKGNNWNTIQFFYYSLYFIALAAAVVLFKVLTKLPRVVSLVIITGVLIITPISSLATFKNGFSPSVPARLPYSEVSALNFLYQQPDGVVLTYPFDKNWRPRLTEPFPLFAYETSSYVSAFSAKETFLEDQIQQDILQKDYQKRVVEAEEFFRSRDDSWSKEFLKRNNIKYIYLLKIYGRTLDENQLSLKHIFNNKDVDIYQLER